jgi:hypothetical protein
MPLKLHSNTNTTTFKLRNENNAGSFYVRKGPPDIVRDGLVLHLDAANPYSYVSGSNTWLDLTGNNNSGSLTNGPIYSTDGGGSIVFDGVDDVVIIGQYPYTLNNIGTSDVTVNVWSKISVSDANIRYQLGVFPRIGAAFPLGYVNGKMHALLNGRSPTATYNFPVYGTATTLPLNTWIMTTAVMDRSSDIKLYFNGEVEPTSGSVDISSADGINFVVQDVYPVCIGGSEFRGPLRLHQGSISIAQLYFRALSAAEVKQNYDAIKGRYGL